jgi:excisionase family DNA binding protein
MDTHSDSARRPAIAPLAVGVDDACRILGGIDRTYLYRLSNAGQIRTFKVGRRRLVTLAELERFIAEREALA